MSIQQLKDARGHKVGEIREEGRILVIRDPRGSKLGEYDPQTNVTRNARGRKVGEGDLLATLLPTTKSPSHSASRKQPSKSKDSSGGAWLLLIIAVGFFLSPGAVIAAHAQIWLNLNLDQGQIWILAITTSACIYALFWAAFRDASNALAMYSLLCLVTICVLAIEHYGFHYSFPPRMLGYLFN